VESEKRDRVIELYQQNPNGSSKTKLIKEIMKETGISMPTIIIYLRQEGLMSHRRDSDSLEKIRHYNSLKLSQAEIAKLLDTTQSEISRVMAENNITPSKKQEHKKCTPEELIVRREHIKSQEYDPEAFAKKYNKSYLPDPKTFDSVRDLFMEYGLNPHQVYSRRALLFRVNPKITRPKLELLLYKTGISPKRLSKKPDPLLESLKKLKKTNEFMVKKVGKEKATKILRSALTLYGNKISTIEVKLKIYNKKGIPLHNNYAILEKDPNQVIRTRNYLEEQNNIPKGGYDPKLITISVPTLENKVEFLEAEGIDWIENPNLLSLSLGTEEKPGTLRKRIANFKSGAYVPRRRYVRSNQ